MSSGPTYAAVAAGRVAGDTQASDWAAQNSLRAQRHDATSEETPLLRDDDQRDGRRVSTWEGDADFDGVKRWRRPSVFWLLPPFFMFALAIGGIVVPKLNLILSLVCREYLVEKATSDPKFIFTPVLLGGNNPQCRIPEVQSLVTEFTLTLSMITGILSALVAPKLGALSDRYGRRRILFVASLGAFSAEIMTIIIASFPDHINYRWLILGSVLDGLSGSFTLGMAISYAYASDCTAPPKRAIAFGYFHACLFAGIALGPLFAALLFKLTDDLLTVFWVALGIHIFFMVFVLLVIPESLSMKRQLLAREKHAAMQDARLRDASTWRSKLQQANIFDALKVLWPTGPGTSSKLRINLSLLAAVDAVLFGVAIGAMTVVIYYTGYQFGWQTDDTSIFVSIVNITRVSGLLILLPLLNYVFRTLPARRAHRNSGVDTAVPNTGSDNLDLWTIRFAILAETAGYVGYALSKNGTYFVISGVVTALGGLGSPTLQSSLTKHVPHDRVGSIMGATGLLHALGRVFFPLIFNMIYAQTVGKYTQAVFVVLASCFGLAFIASFGIRPHVYLEEPPLQYSHATSGDTSPTFNADALVDEEIAGI